MGREDDCTHPMGAMGKDWGLIGGECVSCRLALQTLVHSEKREVTYKDFVSNSHTSQIPPTAGFSYLHLTRPPLLCSIFFITSVAQIKGYMGEYDGIQRDDEGYYKNIL